MPDVRVHNLVKSFGSTPVLHGIDFEAHDGELLTMLGPSGCGKSTTLLCIAGLEDADQGAITCGDRTLFDDSSNTNVPAEKRNLGMVFQSYAIWPHMTVFENVAFPLRLRQIPKREIRERADQALELVEMADHGKRYPHQLSGGQQQRVALARALAYSPGVLLLDEPFSNLDAKLRERARASVRALQQRLQLTTIFVTHDQNEALSISDRILVMEKGRILQSGTPEQIYRSPANRFVAEFVGRCNFLPGVATSATANGPIDVSIDDGSIRLQLARPSGGIADGLVTVAVRPEALDLVDVDQGSHPNVFSASVEEVVFLGDHYQYLVRLGAVPLIVLSARETHNAQVLVRIPPDACTLMTPDLAQLNGAGQSTSPRRNAAG